MYAPHYDTFLPINYVKETSFIHAKLYWLKHKRKSWISAFTEGQDKSLFIFKITDHNDFFCESNFQLIKWVFFRKT